MSSRRRTEPKPRKPVPEAPGKLTRTQEKLAHVTEMHERALTRVRRAITIEQKWDRRRRYYTMICNALKVGDTVAAAKIAAADGAAMEKADPELEAFELEEKR